MHEPLARAWQLHQAGELKAAESAYLQVLQHEPGNGDALNCLGILCMQGGRADQALALFERAVASDAKQAPFRLNVARAALRIGKPQLALDAADAALALVASANAWLLRGVALRDLDRADEARAAFDEGAHRYPDDLALQYNLAVGELDAGHAQAAVAQFEKLSRARPREARVWVGLGNAHAAQGRLERAEQAYRHALSLVPELSDAWRLLGLTLLQRGQPRPAVEALRRGLQGDPRDQAALAALAVAATLAHDPIANVLLDFDAIVETAPLFVAADDARAREPSGAPAQSGPQTGPATTGIDATAAAYPGSTMPGLDHAGLAAEILAHPTLRYDRDRKTTRDGGQTGNLAGATTPLLARLEMALRVEIARRITRANASYASAQHPLARTAPVRWQLNLWATVLNRSGRQDAHLHPSGWLSGVYYVALPEVGEDDESGWIEFGLPPEELAPENGLPRRRLRPCVGELTTFPSYLYHRTVPHAGMQARISLAFDVVPLD